MGIYWHALSPGDQNDDLDRSLSENVINLSKTRECCPILISSICLVNQLIIGDNILVIHFFKVQKMKLPL